MLENICLIELKQIPLLCNSRCGLRCCRRCSLASPLTPRASPSWRSTSSSESRVECSAYLTLFMCHSWVHQEYQCRCGAALAADAAVFPCSFSHDKQGGLRLDLAGTNGKEFSSSAVQAQVHAVKSQISLSLISCPLLRYPAV